MQALITCLTDLIICGTQFTILDDDDVTLFFVYIAVNSYELPACCLPYDCFTLVYRDVDRYILLRARKKFLPCLLFFWKLQVKEIVRRNLAGA